ncbi:MAG: hypothetical protein JJT78_12145 [Leptospira sp.]|nr:hypothetical protein [Leptospira sp.]
MISLNKKSQLISILTILNLFLFIGCDQNPFSKKKNNDNDLALLSLAYLASRGGEPPRFELKQVETETSTVILGHNHKFKLTIVSNQTMENVPVGFSFVEKADAENIDNTQENPDAQKQFYAGSYVIPEVKPGENTYDVVLPTEVDQDYTGSYYVVAVIDPLEVYSKRVKDTDDLYLEDSVEVTVDSSKRETQDLGLEDLVVNDDVLVLPLTDENSLLKGSVGVRSFAKNYNNARLNFKLIAPGGTERNLRVWDGEANGFSSTYSVPFVRTDFPINVDYGLDFNEADTKTFIDTHTSAAGSYTFQVEVTISGDGSLENINQARTLRKSFTIVKEVQAMVRNAGELRWQAGYNKSSYSGEFGSNFSSLAKAGLTAADGAYARAEGLASIRVVGFNAEILKGHLQLFIIPQTSRYGGDMEFRFVGSRVFYRGIDRGYDFSRGRDWNIFKRYEKSKTVIVKIVPVTMVAGMSGTIGFTIGAELAETTFQINAGPYLRAGAYASAAVNAFVASAGIRANLYLLDSDLTSIATASVAVSGRTISGTLTQRSDLNFTGPNGNIQLFAEWVSGIKTCCACKRIFGKRRCFACWPCGVNRSSASLNICSFQSWRYSKTLFNRSQGTSVSF